MRTDIDSVLEYILDRVHTMHNNPYNGCIDAGSEVSFDQSDPIIRDFLECINDILDSRQTYYVNGYENVYITRFQQNINHMERMVTFDIELCFNSNQRTMPIVLDSLGGMVGGPRRSAMMYDYPVSSGIHPEHSFNYTGFRPKGEPIHAYKVQEDEEHFDEELFKI